MFEVLGVAALAALAWFVSSSKKSTPAGIASFIAQLVAATRPLSTLTASEVTGIERDGGGRPVGKRLRPELRWRLIDSKEGVQIWEGGAAGETRPAPEPIAVSLSGVVASAGGTPYALTGSWSRLADELLASGRWVALKAVGSDAANAIYQENLRRQQAAQVSADAAGKRPEAPRAPSAAPMRAVSAAARAGAQVIASATTKATVAQGAGKGIVAAADAIRLAAEALGGKGGGTGPSPSSVAASAQQGFAMVNEAINASKASEPPQRGLTSFEQGVNDAIASVFGGGGARASTATGIRPSNEVSGKIAGVGEEAEPAPALEANPRKLEGYRATAPTQEQIEWMLRALELGPEEARQQVKTCYRRAFERVRNNHEAFRKRLAEERRVALQLPGMHGLAFRDPGELTWERWMDALARRGEFERPDPRWGPAVMVPLPPLPETIAAEMGRELACSVGDGGDS